MSTPTLAESIAFLTDLNISKVDPAGLAVNFALQARRAELFTSEQLIGAKLKLVNNKGLELLDQLVDGEAPTAEAAAPAPTPAPAAAPAPAPSVLQAQIDANNVFDKSKSQAVIASSTMMTYEAGVDAILREAIADALILAKLYADSVAKFESSPKEWFESHLRVLEACGWAVSSLLSSDYKSTGQAAEVHQTIIGLLAAVAGGATGGLLLAKALLEALDKMDEGQWITLWKKETFQSKISQFQFGFASVKDDFVIVNLAFMYLKANTNLYQVLFFKWNDAQADLYGKSQSIILNKSTVLETAPVVRNKIKEIRGNFLSSIMNLTPIQQ